ncbi:MAG: DUF4381 domain-containing protein [Dokdonella sp.]
MSAAAAPGPELRDIHLPPDPSWWPPAPGWWLLAALALAVIFCAARWLLRRRRQQQWRRSIHAELDRIATTQAAQPDSVRLATDISHLLRRASLLIEPHAAGLRDEAWLKFLDERLAGGDGAFQSGAGRLLIDAPYRRASDPAVQALDARALLDLARAWLRAALPRRRDHA